MKFNRRNLFRMAGVAGGTALLPREAEADMAVAANERADDYAILVDLSRCVGCRTCEAACAEANGLPEPDWSDDFSYENERPTTEAQWTAVNRYETSKGEVFVKRQCMHCLQPACAAGCLTKALYKTEEGPVIWREDKCMGCRFCMVSCPFDAPKFEYHSAVPKIQKCRMCWERLEEGQMPACVENCPAEALTFGKRSEMLTLARKRIVEDPDTYVDHIYGEREAGGTGVLYISPVPFEELGFRTDLDLEAYPEKTRDFLTAVPVVLVLWPAMMLAMRRAGERDEVEPGAAVGPDEAEEV
jgi:Fe-S-cluster-containing dehydrogenase component